MVDEKVISEEKEKKEVETPTTAEGEEELPKKEPQGEEAPAPKELEHGEVAEKAAPQEQIPVPQPQPVVEQAILEEPKEEMLPQSKVNEIVQKRVAEATQKATQKAIAALIEKYGVDGEDGLDELFGNGQRFSLLSDEYSNLNTELENLKAENALLRSGIDPSKFDDVKAILSYQKQEVNPLTIEKALASHPEWLSGTSGSTAKTVAPESTEDPTEIPSVVRKLGGEPSSEINQGQDEQKRAMELLGIK